MKTKLKVLIAGRSKDAISGLETQLSSCEELTVKLRHIVNGHADPFYGLTELPDLMILHITGLEGGELEALLERPVGSRSPMIVVSETDDAAAMRLAMKAGARDFLPSSELSEVRDGLESIIEELSQPSAQDGRVVAVINAKGGSGATFLACNLAHLTVCVSEEAAALVGLDMQFPTLPAYFDMKIRHGLLQAIESVDELDAVALDAIMSRHHSGLRLLAARPEDFRFGFENFADKTNDLLDLLQANYGNVIVDVPRRLDELSAQVLSRASRIVLVVQQSLPHIQDATRLQQLLRDQLGIPAERLVLTVNRYNKSAEIQLTDIENAFPDSDVVTVPNQFRDVSESINLGVPMFEHARQSTVTRALTGLQSRLFDLAPADHLAAQTGRLSSLLQKASLQQFFGGH